MSCNVKELRGQRAELLTAAEKLIASARAAGKDLAGAELERFEKYKAEIKDLEARIVKSESLGALGAKVNLGPMAPGAVIDPSLYAGFSVPVVNLPSNSNGPEIGRDGDGRAVPIFSKGQSIEAFYKQQNGFNNDGVTLGEVCRGMVPGVHVRPEVKNALAEGSDPSGGYTVAPMLSTQLYDMLRARSTAFQLGARAMVLDTGKSTTICTIASDPVSTWRAESTAVNTSDMSFGAVQMTPKTCAVTVLASRELIEDSYLFESALMTSLAKSFAAEIDRVALIGAGSGSEPKGVSKMTGVGSISMGTNGAALTNWDPFVQALGTLRTANAADPTGVILHPRSEQELNLLKDTQNRPLARPGCLENLPFLSTSKLSIAETQGTANTASRAIMGNFTELLVGFRHTLTIELLREKYADNLQYGFLAFIRADIAAIHVASFCNVVGIL